MVALNKTYRKTLTPDRSAKDSGHRFYSPEISRWLNSDPIEYDLNLYSYCKNSPVLYSDALGLSGVKFVDRATDSELTDISSLTAEAADMSDFGDFTPYPPDCDGCIDEVRIELSLRVKDSLPSGPTAGARYVYDRHWLGYLVPDEYGGIGLIGSGASLDWLEPPRPEVEAHERGHAKGFWEVVKPCAESALASFCGQVCTPEKEAAMVAAFNSCMTTLYRQKSAQYADAATVAYYSGAGFVRFHPASSQIGTSASRRTTTLLGSGIKYTDAWMYNP
jgi:RHS repeat-associated protein